MNDTRENGNLITSSCFCSLFCIIMKYTRVFGEGAQSGPARHARQETCKAHPYIIN